MIACFDTYYSESFAQTGGVVFCDWSDKSPRDEVVVRTEIESEAYVPGAFFRRELSCLLSAIEAMTLPIDTIIIDGYVWLDADQRKGLGAHLYDALDQKIMIIGVAKKYFKGCDAIEVYRGVSKKPLYVTAAGINQEIAAQHIQSMAGEHPMPRLLKCSDFRGVISFKIFHQVTFPQYFDQILLYQYIAYRHHGLHIF